MRIRRDVLVMGQDKDQEETASELWEDSVSLHWVIYYKGYVFNEEASQSNSAERWSLTDFPIGTIRVRPVIGMVCDPPTSWPASKPGRLTAKAPSQGQPENMDTTIPLDGKRTRSNYFQLSEPMIIRGYRHNQVAELNLVKAVTSTFEGYLPKQFVNDVFGQVIPIPKRVLQDLPDEEEYQRVLNIWKHQIIRAMPCAVDWSGLMYAQARVRRGTLWESHYLPHKLGFKIEGDLSEHAEAADGSRKVHPLRFFGSPRQLQFWDRGSMQLAKLSPAQRDAFNITEAMVRGEVELDWWVRDDQPAPGPE